MAARATFSGFDPYKLTGVEVTDQEVGHGSYATVLKLKYMGLKCAGKKVHELLLRQGATSYTVCRFEEECRLLSEVRHPNIVQFLGVYFQQGVRVPILVMEFLPMNLTSCIEQHGILPQEISYSILHDVALGLCYLHNHIPPVIHRDLSSNNVLLDSNLKAKISDLGVAKILNLTPLQLTRMTQTPGTPTYMPPEVMVANPKYNTNVDRFSYGILMIHIFSGRWPEPQIGPTQIVAGKLIPVTEAERREVFLEAVGNNHPLVDLMLKCINNDPQLRADTSEITQRLAEMLLQSSARFSNRMEMLKFIGAVDEEKESLKKEGAEKDNKIHQNEERISCLKQEAHIKEKQRVQEIKQLKLVHETEIEQLQLQVRDLVTEINLQKSINSSIQRDLEDKNRTISLKDNIISRKNSEIEAKTRAIEEKDATRSAVCKHLTNVREYLAAEKQVNRHCLI